MSKQDDIIGDNLGIAPIDDANLIHVEPTSVVPAKMKKEASVETDFDYARGNLIAVIEKGQEALSGILDVAQMSQHPRSYEVVANIMKTLSDAQKDLMELQQRKQKLTGEEAQSKQTVNNNLFVGSTAELQKLLKQASKEDGNE